ncbi:MAG: thymidine phosphorylase [Bacteroidota bacterium]
MVAQKFNIVSLIRKKRDGIVLTSDEIHFLVDEFTADRVPEYQMSAWLMAGFIRGFSVEESTAITDSMLHSGKVVDLNHIPGVKVDKHSTGGVGDKLSLILAPIVASAGVPVPMISGRGLGHTGGTLDKLESIPGFRTDMDLTRYISIIERHKLVLAGQTEEIAPADKRLYALRDVTATVESIPLIAGSIMSKKLAEGIDALVLDVKVGKGAFMKTVEEAQQLAQALVGIGTRFGKETIAYLTAMNQPLGNTIGNWLEVKESIEVLTGSGPEDVNQLSHLLAGTMIYLGEKAGSVEEGVAISKQQVQSGAAFQKWIDIVAEQGGDVDMITYPDNYPAAQFEFELKSDRDGFISGMEAFEMGIAAIELGAGRKVLTDQIDPAAGIVLNKKVGDAVAKGETILTAYTNKISVIESVTEQLYHALSISDDQPEAEKQVTHRIDKHGMQPFQL